jgi:hypothetical protein
LGKETVGVYTFLPDETRWFLAADIDKKTWSTIPWGSWRPAGVERARRFERSNSGFICAVSYFLRPASLGLIGVDFKST